MPRRIFDEISYLTAFAKATDNGSEPPAELVFPSDASELSDEELNQLHDQAVAAFDALYGDGNVDAEVLSQLRTLADGIDGLREELQARATAAAERTEQASQIRDRVRPQLSDQPPDPEAPDVSGDGEQPDDGDDEDEDEKDDDDDGQDQNQQRQPNPPEQDSLAASSRRRSPLRVNLSGLARRSPSNLLPATRAPQSIRDVLMAAPDVPGFSNGQSLDWLDMGRAVDARLSTFQQSQYELAQNRGRHMRQQFGVAVIQKHIPDDLWIRDEHNVDEVFARAVDETRLPGGSLTAAGGWCAPSETVYDLLELESSEGLLSIPEVGIARGGIRFNRGPDFTDLYTDFPGFHYTEAQVEAGNFGVDANGVGNDTPGDKPCIMVPCPDDWTDVRLDVDGICISAGLLMSRGYPEALARTLRGAIIAHQHRMWGRRIQTLISGSTAVTMPAGQVGATAPLLTAIELQVEHYRYVHRMPRATTLEAVFPFWVRGVIRSDLSRRLGIDLLAVTDAQISAWFVSRGISPQFIYNFQDITGTASAFTSWPANVSFLLYAAGTWVGGTAPIITLGTLYDSALLGQNNFTALFTEEGYLIAQRGFDSRYVTVPVCADGATGAGVAINCDGTEAAATP